MRGEGGREGEGEGSEGRREGGRGGGWQREGERRERGKGVWEGGREGGRGGGWQREREGGRKQRRVKGIKNFNAWALHTYNSTNHAHYNVCIALYCHTCSLPVRTALLIIVKSCTTTFFF